MWANRKVILDNEIRLSTHNFYKNNEIIILYGAKTNIYINSNAYPMIRKLSFVFSRVFWEINLFFLKMLLKRGVGGEGDRQMQRKRNRDTDKEQASHWDGYR